MTNVIPFTRPAPNTTPQDLSEDDIRKVIDCVRVLQGKWSSRFIRVEEEANWAYVYWFGPADDCTPVFSITRTVSSYRVVSWHMMDFVLNGGFSEYSADTIDPTLEFIKMQAAEVAAYACLAG